MSFQRRRRRPPRGLWLFDLVVIAIVSLVVFLLCTAMAGIAAGDDDAGVIDQAVGTPPRVLYVWHDPVCDNSRKFFDDLELQGLRAELHEAGWIVERLDVRRQPLKACIYGVCATPCFVVPGPGGGWWYGYDRERFREMFGLAPLAEAPPPAGAAEQIDDEHLQQWIADAFDEQRQQFEQQLATTLDSERARQQALEQTIAQQQQQLAALADGNPETEERIADLMEVIGQLAEQAGTQHANGVSADVAGSDDGSRVAETAAWVVKVGGHALTISQALGILGATSTGVGGLGLAGLWLFKRWRSRRRTPQAEPTRRDGEVSARAPFPRELDEARELLEIRQSEGRVAALDALRGMFLDDEVEKLLEATDSQGQTLLKDLMTRVDQRVDEIAPLSTKV